MVLKQVVLGAVVFALTSFTPARAAVGGCSKSFVFFDLGDTLLDTSTYAFNPMFYLPGAREYVRELSKRGHPIGMITDVPVTWGDGYPASAPIRDRDSAQIVRLMDFVSGQIPEDGVSWRAGEKPFEWRSFGKIQGRGSARRFQGRILLPHLKSERKDTGNPILFIRARELAAASHCKALYLSEDPVQLEVARSVGLAVFQVGKTPGSFFLPVNQIESYISSTIQE